VRASPIAAGEAVGELLHRRGAADHRDRLDVLAIDRRPGSGVERRLVDLGGQTCQVEARAVDEHRHRRRADLVPQLAGESDDPFLEGAGVGDARKCEGAAVTLEDAQQLAPAVEAARHEDEAGGQTQASDRLEDERLVAGVERVGTAEDEPLRAAEQRRRGQIVERLGQDRRIAVAPQRPDLTPESLAEQAEPALDQERLLAVQQDGGARGRVGQRRQRVALRRRAAQKASTV
jgi:hypothetical protein